MLQIDKNTVEFLVTENMVHEVETILRRDFPRIGEMAGEMADRGVDRVYFVACGSPLCAAQTAARLMERFSSVPATAYSGWDFCDNPPHRLDRKCALIAISHYGKTEEVCLALEKAKAAGAYTVAVTGREENPIAALGDRVVAYGAECIWEAHLLVAYAFVLEFLRRVAPHPELERIAADLTKLPGVLARLVAGCEEKGRALGERASRWPFLYTVAAGPLKPLAYKEGIVTLLEFTWTHGSCLDAAEFRHGPLEVAEPGVPFLFLLGTDESRHTAQRALDFVRRHTDDVIVFDHREIGEGLHPWLAPMTLFVPLEWFCYYLSLHKDHNPDHRRYYGGLAEY